MPSLRGSAADVRALEHIVDPARRSFRTMVRCRTDAPDACR
jgi:hypothetical protein